MKGHVSVQKRYSPLERAKILADYRVSGLTQREFARRVGISLACLTLWLRTSRPQPTKPKASVGFVPVQLQPQTVLEASPCAQGIEIELPGKLLVRLPGSYSQAEAVRFILQLRLAC